MQIDLQKPIEVVARDEDGNEIVSPARYVARRLSQDRYTCVVLLVFDGTKSPYELVEYFDPRTGDNNDAGRGRMSIRNIK